MISSRLLPWQIVIAHTTILQYFIEPINLIFIAFSQRAIRKCLSLLHPQIDITSTELNFQVTLKLALTVISPDTLHNVILYGLLLNQ